MDLVIIHFKNSTARFLFKTWKCSIIPLAWEKAPKAVSGTKFKQGKECGKGQPHKRALARRVPRTGLPTVPLSGAHRGFYTHSNIPERDRDWGRDVPSWDEEGWLQKGGRRKNRGPGEGRSQTNQCQERVHRWGQKSGNLILLKLPTPAYSMGSLCASPEVCIFQCQVTWVSRLCERLRGNALDTELRSTLWLHHLG